MWNALPDRLSNSWKCFLPIRRDWRRSDHVFVEIELAGEKVAAWTAVKYLIVLLNYADAFHGAVDNRRESHSEIRGTGALEIVGRGGIAAGKHLARVVETHLPERDQ